MAFPTLSREASFAPTNPGIRPTSGPSGIPGLGASSSVFPGTGFTGSIFAPTASASASSSPFATAPRPGGGLFTSSPFGMGTGGFTGSFAGPSPGIGTGNPSGIFPGSAPSYGNPSGGYPAPGGTGYFGVPSIGNPAGGPGEYSLTGRPAGHETQLQQVLSNFAVMHNEMHPDYVFKYIMYNRADDQQKHLIRHLQTYNPAMPNSKQQYVAVSEADWMDALKKNPLPDTLYPYQITSWDELRERVNSYNKTLATYWHLLEEAQNKLKKLQEMYASHIGDAIKERQLANKMLLNIEIELYGRIEKIATIYNRVHRNMAAEVSLASKLQLLEKKIETPEVKYALTELKAKTQELAELKEERKEEVHPKELSKDNAKRILRVLEEQRKGIEAISKMHSQNMHEASVLIKGYKELSQMKKT